MKTKLLFTVLMTLVFVVTSLAQDRDKAREEKAIVWYGIDFTQAKFTLVTDDPSTIVNQYMKSINQLVQMEPAKFDLKKFFKKTETAIDLEQVNEFNSKLSPESIISSDEHKISPDEVKAALAKYKSTGKPGLGLIFIAENLNKAKQTGSYYVVFFDQESREIIDAKRYEQKAVGIGFRNYWAGSVYNIMKIWLKG